MFLVPTEILLREGNHYLLNNVVQLKIRMATRRQNGDGFDRLQEMTSDSDAENLGEFESGMHIVHKLSIGLVTVHKPTQTCLCLMYASCPYQYLV